jgi:hypothetical protein
MITAIEAIGIGAAVGLGGSGFLALYLLRRMRERREKLRRGDGLRPEFANDRAFNRLAMARREADLLERQGRDVRSARELIDLSQHEFGLRQFDRAYDLAQSAHETLVAARRRPAPERPAGAPPGPASGPSPVAARPMPSGPPLATPLAATPSEPPPRLARNRAESQFQLRLLESELVTARQQRPRDASVGGAASALTDAQAAFAKEEYTEALRLALRGRRQLGATIETVTLAGARGTAAQAVAPVPGDPVASAEQAAGGERCPSCGHPNLPGDAFCRGCGRPKGGATCPACGAARRPSDVFCGRCGASYA